MSTTYRTGTLIAAAVGVAIATGVGYGLYKATEERNEQRAVLSVIGDTTAQLRDALKTPSPEALAKIEGHLRVAKTWSPERAEATELYLLSARAILRRRADADWLVQKTLASRAALAAHMNRAGRRDTTWIRSATHLKRQVERDYFELDVQLKALADLLDSFAEANKPLAPHVEASLLMDAGLSKQARRDVLEQAKRASAELEKVRRLEN
jgi:hypothetical protein